MRCDTVVITSFFSILLSHCNVEKVLCQWSFGIIFKIYQCPVFLSKKKLTAHRFHHSYTMHRNTMCVLKICIYLSLVLFVQPMILRISWKYLFGNNRNTLLHSNWKPFSSDRIYYRTIIFFYPLFGKFIQGNTIIWTVTYSIKL